MNTEAIQSSLNIGQIVIKNTGKYEGPFVCRYIIPKVRGNIATLFVMWLTFILGVITAFFVFSPFMLR